MPYNNPVPAAIAIVRVRRNDGALSLLGIERKLSPVGGIALPGGYVDENENARSAAARELWEEARLVTKPSQWRLLEDRNAQNRLLLFCEFMYEIPEDILMDFVPTKEVSRVLCLSPQTDICFPNHLDVARTYLDNACPGGYPMLRPMMDMSPEL